MTVYGYARVSTVDQNAQLQFDALAAAGITGDQLFTDQASGAATHRPALDDLLATVVKGDTITVWKLDRLGRSMEHLVNLVAELGRRRVDFRSLTDAIDTRTPAGRLTFHVMAAVAECERDLMLERTRAGLAAARASGKRMGRRPSIKPGVARHIDELADQGLTKTAIAEKVGVSRHAVTRYLAGKIATYQRSSAV